jgi:predicted dehydrogenase
MKAAVIGTGEISVEHLRFLRDSSRAELVGVCDLSPASAAYASQRFGAGGAFTDYHEMLSKSSPQVVHILTPPQTHKQLVSDILNSGAHVICEKPLALNLGDFETLWSLANAKGRTLIEDHNYRFNKPILAIDKLIADGRLGKIHEVEVRLQLAIRSCGRFADRNLPSPVHGLPAGVIHDFITHLSYLALHYVPCGQRVAAAWSNHGGGDLFKYDDLDALIIGDGVHGRIRFTCHAGPDCFTVTVRGEKGYVHTDLFLPHLHLVVPRMGGAKLTPLVNQFVNGVGRIKASAVNFHRKLLQRTPYEGVVTFLDRTYAAIEKGTLLPVTYQDMKSTSELVDTLLHEDNAL